MTSRAGLIHTKFCIRVGRTQGKPHPRPPPFRGGGEDDLPMLLVLNKIRLKREYDKSATSVYYLFIRLIFFLTKYL